MNASEQSQDEWDEAVLDAVFTRSDIGLHVLDTSLRVVRVNTVAVGIRGIPAELIVGRHVSEAYVPAGVSIDESILTGVLETGRPVTNYLVTGHPPAVGGREYFFSTGAHRLLHRNGAVMGVVVTSADVTEREHAKARLHFLHEAHERIGTSLDADLTAQELVDVALPWFADTVVVALTEAVLKGGDPDLDPRGLVPQLRCAAVGSKDGEAKVPAPGSVLVPGIFGAALPAAAAVLPDEAGGRSGRTLAAPLSAHGRVLGAVVFSRAAAAVPFEAEDLAVADSVCARTATCLENALRHTREHVVMTALQSWPVLRQDATQRAVDVVGRHRPGGSGAGSWFDVVALPGARVALVVGQVEGPGVAAVAMMSRLRTAVDSLCTLDLDPHELLARLHMTTLRLAAEQGDHHRTASCTVAVHDPVSGRLDVARAGDAPLVVVRPDGSADTGPVPAGPLLGAEGPPFGFAGHVLPEGSTLCLVSAPGGAGTGPRAAELVTALAHPQRDLEAMADAVDRLLTPDQVLLVARTRRLGSGELAEWEVPFEFPAVAAARVRAEECLERWGHPADPFATSLVVSELVTNAVRYGAAPVVLRLIAEGARLVCEVSDAGQAAPHLRHAKAVDEGGRGLLICASLAVNWGVRYTGEGKTVWAEIGSPAAL
ncbi:SpoIIE family protein phosphatase [Streptomyces sp. NPDC060194]|uniref:SpoIIE family protein phosphatase n=1 Tax=Streptomyces sp. NPDC060194 TaxID=3347069 RepID=UPI00366121CF